MIIGENTRGENLGIDAMVQLKTAVLKAQGHEDGDGMELRAVAVVEPNPGVGLRTAMIVTAFGPGGDAQGNVHDGVS